LFPLAASTRPKDASDKRRRRAVKRIIVDLTIMMKKNSAEELGVRKGVVGSGEGGFL
jgi:hypothetical protein